MRNYQLIPRTIEESRKILPMLENLTNQEFDDLNVVKESSGNVLQIKIPERNVALVSPISNIIYYLTDASENRADYETALNLSKKYEEQAPEVGGWIVRYFKNGNE